MSILDSCNLIEDSKLLSMKQFSDDIQSQFHTRYPSSMIMQNIAELLRKFGNSGVNDFISCLLTNQSMLCQIAKSSYLHQNGFVKIPLIQTDKFTIRLHIWNSKVASKETLHNHRWYLASTVLKGVLRSEIWESSVCEEDPYYDEYLYVDKNSTPCLLGKVKVVMSSKIEELKGNAYVLSPNVLHRITTCPEDGMVATLVCRSACIQDWSRNIIINGLIPDTTPHYMSADSLRSVLLLYLNEEN